MHECTHAEIHTCYFLAGTGTYLGVIGRDQGDIYIKQENFWVKNIMVVNMNSYKPICMPLPCMHEQIFQLNKFISDIIRYL